ncbi:MAG: recombinase [Frondihabitans sp.]|nr:recombinase [Frondihabitans sp.]
MGASEGVFEPIVAHEDFLKARQIILARSRRFSDQELLDQLQALLERHGAISGLIIDERSDMPSSSAYRSRFGSLLRAYQLIGYRPTRDYRYLQINQRLRELHPEVLAEIHAGIARIGGATTTNEETGLVTINGELTVSVAIARCYETQVGAYRWRFAFNNLLLPDITVAIRMAGGNVRPLDYFLFPGLDLEGGRIRVAEQNGLSIDAYRFDDLSELFELAVRIPFARAA